MKLTCFQNNGQDYAVPVYWVREIVNPPKLSLVPGSPEGVLGLINLRGQIITLIDPACFLEAGVTDYRKVDLEKGKLIVFLNDREIRWSALENAKNAHPLEDPLAFYVDKVHGVFEISSNMVQDLTQFREDQSSILKEVFEYEKTTYRILDMQVFFDSFKSLNGRGMPADE